MNFKEKVDFFMKQNSIDNLKHLALKSDIPYTTLRDCYEKDNADNSRMSTIRKLASYMNCTVDYLAYDELESPQLTIINPKNKATIDGIDKILFSKAKMLNDEEKRTIISVIDAIHKDVDKDLDKE